MSMPGRIDHGLSNHPDDWHLADLQDCDLDGTGTIDHRSIRRLGPENKGRRFALLLGASMVLASLGFVFVMAGTPNVAEPPLMHPEAYTPHAPIVIKNDTDFANQASSNGWPGDGSASNPYVIQGYDIESTGIMSGIAIGNTTVHFRVTGCSIHGASTSGIAIFNVTTGNVDNCTFSSHNWDGISIADSNGVSAWNNSCTDTKYGIRLIWSSSGCELVGNNCSGNEYGIYLNASDNNNLTNNNCSSNSLDGISLSDSDNCILADNSAWNNAISGISVVGAHNTIRGCVCNRNAGGMLVTGSYITIDHCTCLYNGESTRGGIRLEGTDNSIVTNNTCQFSRMNHGMSGAPASGIELLNSNNNTIAYNLCSDNEGHGVSIVHSNDNVVSDNELVRNLYTSPMNPVWGSGIYVTDSSDDIFRDNNCSNNAGYGICGYEWPGGGKHDCVFDNNTCVSNAANGIYIIGMEGGRVSNNTIESNGGGGISLSGSTNFFILQNVTVSDNTLSSNNGGIGLHQCWNLTISGNQLVDEGIEFAYDDIEISWNSHNIDPSNTVNGKPVYYFAKLTGGLVPEDAGQVIIASCTHTLVDNATIISAGVGIQIAYSSDISVRNCTLAASRIGISLTSTNSSLFEKNAIYGHESWGMWIYSGVGNTIWNNSFAANNGASDTYDSLHIQASTVEGNYWNMSGRGNYWSDWQTPDMNYDGIVDIPYVLNEYSGYQDNYPLVSAPAPFIPEFQILWPATAAFGVIILLLHFFTRGPGRRDII